MSLQPQIWTEFTRIKNEKELKMRIEEFPKERLEEIFEFLFKFYVPSEPIHKASKISQQPLALEEYKAVFSMISQKMHYQVNVCYVEDGGEEKIVGLSIMVVEHRGQADDDLELLKSIVKTEEIKTLLYLLEIMQAKCNVFEKIDVDSYYKGHGVVVDTDYRRLGIAGELLRVRSLICKAHKVPATSAWMTSVGTQKAAAKLGWQTIQELRYKDIEEETGIEFEDEPALGKLMVITV